MTMPRDSTSFLAWTYKDPRPTRLATNASHLCYACSEQSSKAACQRCSREENRGPDPKLATLVPARKIVVDAWEQPCLSDAEEESCCRETLEIVYKTHGDHDDSPQDHGQGQEDLWTPRLEQDVGQGLEPGVADEKKTQYCRILWLSHVEIWQECVYFGITDVRSVEEGDEIEQRKPWYELPIELSHKRFILWARE